MASQFFANDDIVSLQDTLIPTPGETVFSARLDISGGRTSETGTFIASVSAGGGVMDIVFVTDFFSEAPSVVAIDNQGGPELVSINQLTAAGVRLNMFPRGSGVINHAMIITVQRQGADYDAARAETTRLGDL